jgi:hypothetical protein
MPHKQVAADLAKAKSLNLVDIDRWSEGMDHHPMSERSIRFIAAEGTMDISVGGDGDDGETMMFVLDAFWESKPDIKVSPDVISRHLAAANLKDDPNVIAALKAIFLEVDLTLVVE